MFKMDFWEAIWFILYCICEGIKEIWLAFLARLVGIYTENDENEEKVDENHT